MSEATHVQVDGLKRIRRELISADKRYGKEIRTVLKETAEIVASDARLRIPTLTGNAKKSIKGGSSGPNAVVRGGSNKKVPYYGWLDFGGTIKPKGTPIVREGLKEGRYIYPAIRLKMPYAVRYLQENLAKLILKGTAE